MPEVLCRYDWPGNVRELRNVCERLVVLSNGRPVDAAYLRELHMFQDRPAQAPAGTVLSAPGGTTLVLPPTVRKKDLAKELGVSRTTLWRMTKRQEEAARKQREETSNS